VEAEGWYVDPFARHEARWFSEGTPTDLVRDGRSESHDPPDAGFTGPVETLPEAGDGSGEDLLRADEPTRDASSGDGPFQAFTDSGGSFV